MACVSVSFPGQHPGAKQLGREGVGYWGRGGGGRQRTRDDRMEVVPGDVKYGQKQTVNFPRCCLGVHGFSWTVQMKNVTYDVASNMHCYKPCSSMLTVPIVS